MLNRHGSVANLLGDALYLRYHMKEADHA